MWDTVIELKKQPPRSYNQKRRLASRMRAKNRTAQDIKRVVWHPENSPKKVSHDT